MSQPDGLNRITCRPDVFDGKPIVRNVRISVESVLGLLAQGESEEALHVDYPELDHDDIRACIAYAHAAIANESLDAVKKKCPGEAGRE